MNELVEGKKLDNAGDEWVSVTGLKNAAKKIE